MGYLSQKKKHTNIKELLSFSLIALIVSWIFLFFLPKSTIAAFISQWLFHIYIYTLIVFAYAIYNRFFWYASGLLLMAFILFLNIGMGSSLFFSVQAPGLQNLNIIYQSQSENVHDIEKQMTYNDVDVACLTRRHAHSFKGGDAKFNISSSLDEKNIIITPHQIFRSGEVLLSRHNRAGFADIGLGYMRIVFVTLDFSSAPKIETPVALKNLAEFINMQDIPVIVVGNFAMEAWNSDFLQFMEKSGLEVKNSIILSDGRQSLNPFVVPTLNVLAYKDFGVQDLSFLNAKHNIRKPLLIKLNY